ncbi:hypothetical protein [Mycolicibacterium aubagnense]|uniref:Uncharacterized protein n=1 Tax=Mycolicibacterium aubagnense TaxID=319707 RepID=A0ABN5YU90_9MYCO|nr:hypothetical protein [Mycolicibacterium aubagnense]BBX85347.1 hypothetical protein MAUB_32200 [Mycolicibacterium aubagnense]
MATGGGSDDDPHAASDAAPTAAVAIKPNCLLLKPFTVRRSSHGVSVGCPRFTTAAHGTYFTD